MMRRNNFKFKDLFKCDNQYLIRHTSTDQFKKNDIVFLKSNPEWPMRVFDIEEYVISCVIIDSKVEGIITFSPECILQYKYAGLLIYNEKYIICLN